MLTSKCIKDKAAGLRYYAAYERERRHLAGGSMDYAARVTDAEVAREVAGGPADTGATPESLSREVAEIVRQNGVDEAAGAVAEESEGASEAPAPHNGDSSGSGVLPE